MNVRQRNELKRNETKRKESRLCTPIQRPSRRRIHQRERERAGRERAGERAGRAEEPTGGQGARMRSALVKKRRDEVVEAGSSLLPVVQSSRQTKQQEKQLRAKQKRKGKAKALLEKHRQRVHKFIGFTTLGVSVVMLSLILASIILVVQVEYCRYPRHSKMEEYRYEIKFDATELKKLARDGKIKKVIGPRIDELRIEQFFGTVKFVENADIAANEIVFRVNNRAADKYFLTRIAKLRVTLGEVPLLVGKETSELRANVTLEAKTSNSLSGEYKCRRADIEVEVPTACLLDETKLFANVTKGHITSTNLSAANFETITMANEVGDITANDLHAFKVELNTSTGTITTNNTACHSMRVNTDEDKDGALLYISNVTLFEGDNKTACVESLDYAPGFPQTPEYQIKTLKCETAPGVLVIDSKGAENAGKPAITLGRIKGGNVKQKIKVGHTRLQIMGCLDFIGDYILKTSAGAISINEKINKYKNTGFSRVALNQMNSLISLNTSISSSKTKYGSICKNQTIDTAVGGESRITNQTIEIEAEVTGDIYFDVYPPYIT